MPDLAVGDAVHGFCGGAFGRDSYACRRVEAVGRGWVVTRNTRGEVEFTVHLEVVAREGGSRDFCYASPGCAADGEPEVTVPCIPECDGVREHWCRACGTLRCACGPCGCGS